MSLEIIVLTAKDKQHGNSRKFTLVRPIATDKLMVMLGTVLGMPPHEGIKFEKPMTITQYLWSPECLEIYRDGIPTIRTLSHHTSERAWGIVRTTLNRTIANQRTSKPLDYLRYSDILTPDYPKLLPSITEQRRAINKTEHKVRKLNDSYRSMENAVLIMRGSPIDNVLREIYDEGRRNVDERKFTN